MKPSEFYEKYWEVQNKKGVMVSPPLLSDLEKDFLDKAMEGKEETWGIVFLRKRQRRVDINVASFKAAFDKHINFLIK